MTTFPLHAMHVATAEFIVQESVVGPDDGDKEEEDEDNEVALLAVPEER